MRLFLLFLFITVPALGKLKIVATTTDVSSIVKKVAGDKAEVTAIAKGGQDPHYIEAKPSFMVKIRDADLVVANGLSLEEGWLPSLLRGGRNPKVQPQSKGYIELSHFITPLQVQDGKITRAMGDIHPDGNPHFTLDPLRVGECAIKLADRLGELDPANKESYIKNAQVYQADLKNKTEIWKKRLDPTTNKKVVTYHSSLTYFLERFGLSAAIYLEPKPGVPPSAQHILSVIETTKKEKIRVILVDNFFDTKIADRVAKEIPSVKVASVGIAVDSAPGLNNIEDVIEQLVRVLEGK